MVLIILNFSVVFSVISFQLVLSQKFKAQPRIKVTNGNLRLIASDSGNITFETPGTGTIKVNEIDIAAIASNSKKFLDKVKVYDELFDDFNDLQETIQGTTGLISRIAALEGKNVSSAGISFGYPSNNLLLRRINNLARKLRRLTNLLIKNECTSNPCQNGGKCEDVFNGFICKCAPEWQGSLCELDVNECARFAGTDLGCQNGATCINKPGSYECTCANGWVGLHCTRRTADCNSGSESELCGHGTCISQNTKVGYKCVCDQGWKAKENSLACTEDVNECELDKPPCSVNPPTPCINVPGSFYCGMCPAGYSGNGYYCSDIDECATDNGGCSINPKVQCINLLGSSMCGPCPSGFEGDGKSCIYKGVCQINNGGCHHLATCKHLPTGGSSVSCTCPSNYTGVGIGPYGCIQSIARNGCDPNPCVHGTCNRSYYSSTYYCTCHTNYTGRNCDIEGSPCSSNPCQNGGTCRVLGYFYLCRCTPQWAGRNCQIARSVCGGKLRDPEGSLQYPPNNSTVYSHLLSCAWTIEAPIDKVLNISFTKFNIENSGDCQYDWLQIHDGRNSAATNIGRFCGSNLPKGGNIMTTTNIVYLWFRSDQSVAKAGFSLNWKSVQPACGEKREVTSHGKITSPGSPGNYPANRDCYWNLKAPTGKRFEFHFFTLMIGNDKNCTADYLEFREGLQASDPIFAKYCTSGHPSPLVSPGSEVAVHFHSDASGSYPGFQISYSLIGSIPGCGGVFTFPYGEIKSPVVDGSYPPNILCEYKIKVDPSSRIEINFTSFDIEGSNGCSFDYVAIYEGNSVDDPIVGKFCRTDMPPNFGSNGNELFIVFKSDLSGKHKGFTLKYKAVCHLVYTDPTGYIDSGDVKRPCIYEIIQPLNTVIMLNFMDVKEEKIAQACKTGLDIQDAETGNHTLFKNFCQAPSSQVLSSYNHLWIKLNPKFTNFRLKANYTTNKIGCGGILTKPIDTIASPNYPNQKGKVNCTWIVYAPKGHVVQLTFVTFHLDQSFNCFRDYLILTDNNPVTGGQIGKFCGTTLPPTIVTSYNILTISFMSDLSISVEGFSATYRMIPEGKVCDGRYYSTSGTLKSPNYPDKYPNNKLCTWIINVPPGYQIVLNVTHFELESHEPCRYDFLEIRNGGTASSPLLGIYCRNIPKQIISHANKLYIKFKSDISKNNAGFHITWSSAATGCGGTLASSEGTITSPNYPEPYDRSTECYWKIAVSAGSVVQVVFADMDLEAQTNCFLDYVEIYDGKDVFSRSLGRYCTEHPPTITTTTNVALIKFRSDLTYSGRGFFLRYSTLCNITLKGYRGAIESPNFPNLHPNNLNCLWTIQVPKGNKINITFSHFEIERQQFQNKSCLMDYVEVLQIEEDEDQESLGKFCGNTLPPLISTTKTTALVKLRTDNLVARSGFRLEWILVGCGGELTKPEGEISSPNYPNAYPLSTECNWTIKADYGKSIRIQMIAIDFENSDTCMYDYLSIYGGPDDSFVELARFCNEQNKTFELTSSSNVVLLHFVTDASYNSRGFKLNYTFVDSKCGGKLTAPKGKFHSPNYPNNFNTWDTCSWLIEVRQNHRVSLTIEDITMGFLNTCHNHIEIYDGPSDQYPKLQKLCNDKPNSTIYSTTNVMFVIMKTSTFKAAKGFRAAYEEACGSRLFVNGTGVLDYREMNDFDECSWTLIASRPDQRIYLTISHISLTCMFLNNSLYVFNGQSNKSPLIGSYCGTEHPPTIVSDGNSLHLEVEVYKGSLFAIYSVFESECGASLESESGKFSSPKYPNSYPVDVQCEWTINVAPGNKVLLSFTELDISESVNCNEDFLEIRERDSAGKVLGVLCGTNIPTNITSYESLWLLFNSMNRTSGTSGETGKGFLATYQLEHGLKLSGSRGKIASPLYPRKYSETEDFTWVITVDFGYRILIKFLDLIIDSSEEASACYISRLALYDGPDENFPELLEVCSDILPDPVKSSSNQITVLFSNTDFRHGSKFMLEWLQVERSAAEVPVVKPILPGCGSNETIDLTGLILFNVTSPGYPYGYENNLQCEWIFSTSSINHVALWFEDIDLEDSFKCFRDNVAVFTNSKKEDWKELVRVCATNYSLGVIQGGNLMKIVFTTDRDKNKTGFSASVWQECGGEISAERGIISVDNSTYIFRVSRREKECHWNVSVKTGRRIQVQFLQFYMDQQEKVCGSYVLLKNGQYEDSPILGDGKYCGTSKPPVLQSTGNYIHIKFLGNPFHSSFKLEFSQISNNCGNTTVLQSKDDQVSISSPNFPNIPKPHSECKWVIRGAPGESLQLDFDENFSLTPANNCTAESVEVRDGGTEYSPLIGIYCKTIPSTIRSTDNMLFVKFTTDISDPRNGFKATIKTATCGGTIRAKNGNLSSPNYGNKNGYPRNADCSWHIKVTKDHFIKITFNDLDMVRNGNFECKEIENVTISEVNPVTKQTNVLGTYCGNVVPRNPIMSSGDEVIVRFTTTNTLKYRKGFTLSFQEDTEECGGSINAESGFIQSLGYPVMHHSKINCAWEIEVPKGRRVKVEILDYDVPKRPGIYQQGVGFFNRKDFKNHIINVKPNANVKFVESSDNTILVYLWSFGNSNHRGFKAKFTSLDPTICKGDFSLSSGTISNPIVDHKSFYCSWEHKSESTDKTLAVTLTLRIRNTTVAKPNCKYATTVIHLSTAVESQIIYSVCSTMEHPVTIRSPFPTTTLTAVQGSYLGNLTFKANYNTYPCGGILKNSAGTITSPMAHSKYNGTLQCAWQISLKDDQTISLIFKYFELDSCEKSYLVIYNGPMPTSPKIGKYCGNHKPDNIVSQGNSLWIDYFADSTSSSKGLVIDYESVNDGCGGIYFDTTTVLLSPSYPQNYPNNAECSWELNTHQGYHINLEFLDRFQLEESQDCTNDYIEIFKNVMDEWKTLGKICGREPKRTFNSTSNKMKVLFRSNNKTVGAGFKAKWSLGCGGVFEATTAPQYIISPGYPKEYHNGLSCIYNITSPDKIITIFFEDFDVEKGTVLCKYDNITITDPSITRSYIYSQPKVYCGTTKPDPIRLKNLAVVKFSTDQYITRRGFKFRYQLDACGGNITQPTEISSPVSSSIERDISLNNGALNCEWYIIAPSNKAVVIRFEKFELESHVRCSYEYLEIYNNLTMNVKDRLAILCGNLTLDPPIVKSNTNLMALNMKTNYGSNLGGFKAFIYFTYGQNSGCGGSFQLSPNKEVTVEYPETLRNADCHWEITTSESHVIKIKPVYLRLSSCNTQKNCTCFVEIRDGGGPFAELMDKLCEDTVSKEYFTTSTSVFIRIVSETQNKIEAKFKITTELAKCGETMLTANKSIQILTSPNYPNTYPSNIKCVWTIKADVYYKVFLKITDLDLSDTDIDLSQSSCVGDRIEIYDKKYTKFTDTPLGENTIVNTAVRQISYDFATSPVGVHEFCGRNGSGFDYYTSFDEVNIKLISGKNHHGRGFKLEYHKIGCTRNYTDVQGRVVISQKLAESCEIWIIAPEGYKLSLYFLSFYLFATPDCTGQGMKIIDGVTNKNIATLCGFATPNPIYSTGNKIIIKASPSSQDTNHVTLDLTYSSTKIGSGCGGEFYNFVGKFASPMYPGAYKNDTECVFDVKGPYGMEVVGKFITFDVQAPCATDYVVVTTYNHGTALNHKFCQNSNPAVLRSSYQMTVRYKTSKQNGGTGWVFKFHAVTADHIIRW